MTREEIINVLQDDKMMPFIQPDQLAKIVDFVSENYKPSLPDGLEEELKRYISSDEYINTRGNGTLLIARHFAEWGAKQVKSKD